VQKLDKSNFNFVCYNQVKSLLHRLDYSIPLHIHFPCESTEKIGENYARTPLLCNQKRGLREKAKKKKVDAGNARGGR